MPWDVYSFRDHFPFYSLDNDIVYLDNAATTQKNIETIDTLNFFIPILMQMYIVELIIYLLNLQNYSKMQEKNSKLY